MLGLIVTGIIALNIGFLAGAAWRGNFARRFDTGALPLDSDFLNCEQSIEETARRWGL